MTRVFICVEIPEKIKKRTIKIREELIKLPIDAKFVEKENLHITLLFIGEVHIDKIVKIKKKMDLVLSNFKGFNIEIGGISLIPNENVRVIGIETKSEKLKEIKNILKREIKGHSHELSKITLCRLRKRVKKILLKGLIEKRELHVPMNFHVKNIYLMKSTLTKTGPIYEKIHKVNLGE